MQLNTRAGKKRQYGSNANTDVTERSDAEEAIPHAPRSTPASASPQRRLPTPNHITSPSRPSMGARGLRQTPRVSQKRIRQSNSNNEDGVDYGHEGESEEEEEEEEEDELHRRHTRQTAGDSRRSGSNWSMGERGDVVTHEEEGFFHDLSAMQPLRVRLGVCPLPEASGRPTMATTALLLPPRKFFTLPKEKGGADLIGWAAAFPAVSVDLPGEGVYNKASVSVTVMLPP